MAHISDKHGNLIDPTLLAPDTRMILHCQNLAGHYDHGGIHYQLISLENKGDVFHETETLKVPHTIMVTCGGVEIRQVFQDKEDVIFELHCGEVPFFSEAGHEHIITSLYKLVTLQIEHVPGYTNA